MTFSDIQTYITRLSTDEQEMGVLLTQHITAYLSDATSKVRHGHPVWFLEGNPVVGWSKQKTGICVLFWSGQSFDETELLPSGSFKAAQISYTNVKEIVLEDLTRRLQKAKDIQRDYKNIVKRKGVLERLQ